MTDHPALPTVAVLGLGIIGSRAADHLAAAGYPLRTWNRTPKERADYESDPVSAASPAEIVAIYLKDSPTVRDIFERIRPALRPGKTIVNHATIDLATTAFLEEACADLRCDFINAPFTGSKVAAGNGALVYYAGGDPEVLNRLRPFLETTSTKIIPVDSPAAGTILKLTTNLITASTVQALAEGLKLNLAHGISAEAYLEAIEPNACASVLATMKIPGMASGDFDPHFSLSNMLKDSRYMLDLAQRADIETPGIATTSREMEKLDEAGHGDLDFSVLFRQFESNSS